MKRGCKYIMMALGCMLLMTLACSAQTQQLTIANWSFESPVTANDTWGGTPTGWVVPAGSYNHVLRPVVNQPNAQEGAQVLGLSQYRWVYQDLAATWDTNLNYTLTLYGATPSFSGNRSGIHVGLRDAALNTTLASTDVWLNNPGQPWMQVQVTVAGSNLVANAGHGIRIFIQKPAWSGAGYTIVDNVQLIAVPEPSTVMLIGAGLGFAMLLLRRRRG